MKSLLIILSFIFILVLFSCGGGTARPENPAYTDNTGQSFDNRLYNYYIAFRGREGGNLLKGCPVKFLYALTNEFISNLISGDKALSDSANAYFSLTNIPDFGGGFIYQRIGAVFFKLRDYRESDKYINTALYKGTKNPELYYYKAMLLYYYKKDYSGAEGYLAKLNGSVSLINNQDILYLKACLKCEKFDFDNAYSLFMTAKAADPGRFFTYYDILPYFIKSDILGKLGGYIGESFKYLTSLSNSNYRLKAYRQLITYNKLQNRETLYIPFNLPEYYDYSTNLFYLYSGGYPLMEKRKSQNIISPLQEKRKTARDLVYSPVYEEYVDSDKESSLFLQEGIVKLTNARLFPYSYSYSVPRLITVSNVILLLSPTNRFDITSNIDSHDKSKINVISNARNELYITNCGYDYYFATGIFALGGDKTWDFVTIGFTASNKVVVTLFYPLQKRLESYSFSLKRHDSAFVIQDLTGKSKPELVLLDDDVYILGRKDK